MIYPFLVVSLVSLTVRLVRSQSVPNVTHETFLDPSRNFFIRWTFNATHIDLEMTAMTLGWLAVGISPNGGMDQSDVFMGWVDDRTRRAVVQDRWNNAPPTITSVNLVLDTQQDWNMVSGSQNTTHTTVRAIRKLVTCDAQDLIFTTDTMRLIYATNPSDPRTPQSISKHTVRGGKSVLLLSDAFRSDYTGMVANDTGAQEMDLLVNEVTVTADETTLYHCSLVKLPTIDQKYHIVAIKPSVTPGNEGMVHHLLAYLCNSQIDDDFPTKDFDCSYDQPNPTREMVTANCTAILAVFGIGSDTYYFPPQAGLPLTPDMSGMYVFLEMHYNNPDGQAFVDNSGISLTVTSNLRPNDAAIMFTGSADVDWTMVIPPLQDNFTFYSRCSKDCTTTNIPKSGLNVINVFLHTHLLGRKIYLRQIRNKKEMTPLAKDEMYDFNYQETQRISPPRVILPGDELIVECHYSSKGRTNVTFGGWSSGEEMCMAFVTYYPATKMVTCVSNADAAALIKLTSYTPPDPYDPTDPTAFDDAPFRDYLNSGQFSWSSSNVAKLTNLYKAAPYAAICTIDQDPTYIPNESPVNYTPFTPLKTC